MVDHKPECKIQGYVTSEESMGETPGDWIWMSF